MSETTSQAKTYQGGCHCKAVRFEVQADLSKPVGECNCSICQMRGWLLTSVTGEQFKLQSGEEQLTDYQFGKQHIHHLFCSRCGVSSFARGKHPKTGSDLYVVNARCLDGVEPKELTRVEYDGRKL